MEQEKDKLERVKLKSSSVGKLDYLVGVMKVRDKSEVIEELIRYYTGEQDE